MEQSSLKARPYRLWVPAAILEEGALEIESWGKTVGVGTNPGKALRPPGCVLSPPATSGCGLTAGGRSLLSLLLNVGVETGFWGTLARGGR